MESTETSKTRLTLYVDDHVKEELKKQSRDYGMSASAYVTMLVMERRDKDDSSDDRS